MSLRGSVAPQSTASPDVIACTSIHAATSVVSYPCLLRSTDSSTRSREIMKTDC